MLSTVAIISMTSAHAQQVQPDCQSVQPDCPVVEQAAENNTALLSYRHSQGLIPKPLGGAACPEGNYSSVAALILDGLPHCSAVIIHKRLAVTAAHCIKNFDTAQMSLRVGVDALIGYREIGLDGYDVHENYQQGAPGDSDLAVLILAADVPSDVPIPQLPRSPLTSLASPLMFVGYGPAPNVELLQQRCLSMPVVDSCELTFVNSSNNRNTCQGDSGGGVFSVSSGELVLQGLTSWGDCDCDEFGVSVDVGAHRHYLKAMTFDYQEGRKPWFKDSDGDGFGYGQATWHTTPPGTGFVTNGDDCDDNSAEIKPGAAEVCDGVDNNCNGAFDESSLRTVYYADTDGDGAGDPDNTQSACMKPAGTWVEQGDDCDDQDSQVHPGSSVWLSEPSAGGTWDANCDGNRQPKEPTQGHCEVSWSFSGPRSRANPPGWLGTVPVCGQPGTWLDDCDNAGSKYETRQIIQQCR